jgi:hypothetical protein
MTTLRPLLTALILMLTPAYAALAQGAPYLVHASDTPPGYTMVLTGGDYDPATVQVVVHVPGTEEKQRPDLPRLTTDLAQRYPGQAAPLPLTPPAFHTFTLKPFQATERSVFVELPKQAGGVNYPPGFTALVWLKQGDRLSNPLAVNRPAAWFLLKNTSRPGEMNRICGWNFKGDLYMKNYVFLRPAGGGQTVELPQEERHHEDGVAENFCVQFRLPADLAPGDYQVFLHNNSGDMFGFTEALPLKVVKEPDFPQTLSNALEAGVKGDSFTDDLPALQALVDKVGQAGGGIVYLPAGAYRLNDTLQLRANVILRGAGREATTLFFGGDPAAKTKAYWFISSRDVNHTGLEDLTIRVSPPMTIPVSYYNNMQPIYDCHINRVHFEGGELDVHYAVNFEIGDCFFDRCVLLFHNMARTWIHDNEATCGRLRGSPFSIWASENCTVEHNRAFGSNRGLVWQIHGVTGHYHNLIDANVVEADRFGANAGETFLFEGAGLQWFGKPGTVEAGGFTVPGAGWKPGDLKSSFAVVVGGRGLGEYVRIADNTADRATLVRPWPVPPGGDVRISVMRGVVENAFCNNRDVDCDNSMMFYGAGIINNRIIRNRSDNSLGISVWSWAEAEKSMLIPDYFNVFDGNVLEDQGSFWMTTLGDIKQEVGVRNLDNLFRNNFLNEVRRKRENQYGNVWEDTQWGMYRPIQSAFWLDIGRSYSQDRTQTPIWIDTLIERNYVTRCDWGVELRKISGGTVVKGNTFFDVKLPIIDQGTGDRLLDNRTEMPVYENPPPWAGVDRGK